ncbi:DNA integrity scanning diadenylate cyclase DisA [Nocardia lijiangensis]|uniref:DNA integrity scanning diadenylate cyclase DisA n=1 Tax=Nocardia lijiangensis TaxID=299618 RepID=UPI0008329283|nr:DNA integrity scanning diadenylate cyclase DisA [Nocardia lijiangensis]
MAAPANRLPEVVTRLAPGTPLRDGLERIQRGRTGGLIVLGYDEGVERLCDGGFELDVEFAPTRLRELSKMDGAVVLSTDGSRILRANVHLVPDPNLPSAESGTRHRAAERTAAQTGHPVVAVSKSMRTMTLYVDDIRHLVEPSATILARANQALGTLERYKARLDQVCEQLSESEIEDVVTLRDALTAAQRLEMVRRLAEEIEQNVLELGADGRQLALQLEDLVGDNAWLRELLIRDYLADEPVASAGVDRALAGLDLLTDAELLDLTNLAAPLGYPSTIEALDLPMRPRGYRVLTRIPRLRFTHIESLVDSFGSLQGLLVATASDLESIDGIGVPRARQIREGLTRLAEADMDDSFARDR